MVSYSLSHLTQDDSQKVAGPIQDDEALVLYALIRCMRLLTVLEIGGLSGYSARNFCEAVGPAGTVVTIDLSPVPLVAANHIVICGDALCLVCADFPVRSFDLVFFDCHDYDVEMQFAHNLIDQGLIDDRTVIAAHDTNTHPLQVVPWAYRIDEGWIHQSAERRLVNDLKELGFDAFSFHSRHERHNSTMPFRHGLTILQKFRRFAV